MTRVDLSLNDIQDKGTAAVAKLLEINSLIVDVNLSENKIGKDRADAIVNCQHRPKLVLTVFYCSCDIICFLIDWRSFISAFVHVSRLSVKVPAL